MIKNVKKIVVTALLVFTALLAIGVMMYNKPHKNIAKAKVAIAVTSNKILNDFESDETKANTKYLEQVLEVTGVISEKSKNKGKGILTLSTNGTLGSVMCYLSETETQKFNTLKEGLQVTVKGVCTGYLMDVVLVRCILTN